MPVFQKQRLLFIALHGSRIPFDVGKHYCSKLAVLGHRENKLP
jgi:hypothetical protein